MVWYNYLPTLYDGIKEPITLLEALQSNIDNIVQEYSLAFNRQTVKTADEKGVLLYEKILNIYPEPTDTLEFRKQRIIERLSHQPPFTFRYLISKLDKIIGKDKYQCWVDFGKRELYLKSSFVEKGWFLEVSYLIRRIKPANMIYVYLTTTFEDVVVSEQVSRKYANWNYHLGYWRLGEKPFFNEESNFTIFKRRDTMSIKNPLLKNTAECIKAKITKVVFNDNITVNSESFESSSIQGNNLIFTARIKAPNEDITHYKVYAGSEIYSEAAVFVPKGEETLFEFNILFKEGI